MPVKLLSSVLQFQWKAAVLPLSLSQYWLSGLATLLLRLFVVLGAPPRDYKNNNKVSLHVPTGPLVIWSSLGCPCVQRSKNDLLWCVGSCMRRCILSITCPTARRYSGER